MNLTEIKKQLDKLFSMPPKQGDNRNIIFWYDENSAFDEYIDTLDLENAKIIKLYNNNMFATKLYIEEKDTTNNLLVYSPMPRPDNTENFLTDTIKYSMVFSADETTIHMLNLDIDNSLHEVVDKYKTFFRANERFERFESYNIEPYSETSINVGVLSAVTRLSAPNLDNVIIELMVEFSEGETTLMNKINKFANKDVLFSLIRKSYGYSFEEFSLEKLIFVLFATHLYSNMDSKFPKISEIYVSTNTNCIVLIDNFMKNTKLYNNYKLLSNIVSDKLNIDKLLKSLTIDDITDCDTFDLFDKNIILRIQDNISQEICDYEQWIKIINHRRNKSFFENYKNEYTLLLYTCEFFILVEKYKYLIADSAEKLFENYTKNYYKLDFCYRKIILFSDKLQNSKNGFLLSEQQSFLNSMKMIENTYTNWFLNELSIKWCDMLDEKHWHLEGPVMQHQFYNNFVYSNEKAVVIISDGLRYESATELTAILNAEQRGSVQLSSMLGVIPSCTKLGMASLLPHRTIEFTDKGEVLVDGLSSQGTENREKILKQYKQNAVTITYDKFISLAKDRTMLKDKFRGVKLIYIYHNTIDAHGDNLSTEKEVFDATETGFKDISNLVRLLKNNISAINIYITSDHGYIYKREPLTESDKITNEFVDSIEKSRRFFVTKENLQKQGIQSFSLDYLNGTKDIYAVTPRATNCFKLKGAGSNYVHGGTSLQEVVVPVIKFKSDKNASKPMDAKKVNVGLITVLKKLTNAITYLVFFQYELVEEKVLPIKLKAYFVDDYGDKISNEIIIIAESTSIEPKDRTYKKKFILKNMEYDKTKQYFLVLEDEEKLINNIQEKIPFTIDLNFDYVKF